MSQVRASTSGSAAKNLPANSGDARDLGSIPGGRNGNPFQYSYRENCMARGTWWATVHGDMTEQLSTQAQLVNVVMKVMSKPKTSGV